MTERILVPLDGSPRSEAILPWVEALSALMEAELILARVENPVVGGDPLFVPNPPVFSEAPEEAARKYLDHIGAALREKGISSRSFVMAGGPAEGLRTLAAEQRVALIAMSTHGRTGLLRLVLGSTAENVIRQSPAPVFVLRSPGPHEPPLLPRSRSAPFRNILVPLEGSELAPGVLPFAAQLAGRAHAQVHLLHVLEAQDRPEAGPMSEGALAERFLEEAGRQVAAAGAHARSLLSRGDPARSILEACRQQEIDLIALTTHGRSGLSRWIAGSVTETVLREATVPLLIASARHEPAVRKRRRLGERSGRESRLRPGRRGV